MKKKLDHSIVLATQDQRKQIEKDYNVKDGRIYSPGKFELEHVYVPYYWDIFLNGCADSDNGDILTFKITPEDRAVFPELPKRQRTVKLIARSDGFVVEV